MKVPLTVNDFLDRAALVYGDRIGIVDEPDQPAPSLGQLTYRRVRELARAQAAALDHFGIGFGERVAVVSPNAARLFYAWSMTAGAQQMNVDVGGLRSAHPLVKERPDRRKLSEVKTLREDAAAVADQADAIKARYVKLFKV